MLLQGAHLFANGREPKVAISLDYLWDWLRMVKLVISGAANVI